jgi:hypothetical protein
VLICLLQPAAATWILHGFSLLCFGDVHLVAAASKLEMLFLVHLPLYCICMKPELCGWNNVNTRLSTMVTLLCCTK